MAAFHLLYLMQCHNLLITSNILPYILRTRWHAIIMTYVYFYYVLMKYWQNVMNVMIDFITLVADHWVSVHYAICQCIHVCTATLALHLALFWNPDSLRWLICDTRWPQTEFWLVYSEEVTCQCHKESTNTYMLAIHQLCIFLGLALLNSVICKSQGTVT